jgi:hypothetical protein
LEDKQRPSHPLLLNQLEHAHSVEAQLRNELSNVQEQLGNATRQLEIERLQRVPRNIINPHKIGDTVIIGKWKDLRYSIRTLSHLLSGLEFNQYPNQQLVQFMQDSSDRYHQLIQKRQSRCELFQACLWRLVDDRVFEGRSKALHLDPRAMLQELKLIVLGKMTSLSFVSHISC